MQYWKSLVTSVHLFRHRRYPHSCCSYGRIITRSANFDQVTFVLASALEIKLLAQTVFRGVDYGTQDARGTWCIIFGSKFDPRFPELGLNLG